MAHDLILRAPRQPRATARRGERERERERRLTWRATALSSASSSPTGTSSCPSIVTTRPDLRAWPEGGQPATSREQRPPVAEGLRRPPRPLTSTLPVHALAPGCGTSRREHCRAAAAKRVGGGSNPSVNPRALTGARRGCTAPCPRPCRATPRPGAARRAPARAPAHAACWWVGAPQSPTPAPMLHPSRPLRGSHRWHERHGRVGELKGRARAQADRSAAPAPTQRRCPSCRPGSPCRSRGRSPPAPAPDRVGLRLGLAARAGTARHPRPRRTRRARRSVVAAAKKGSSARPPAR